MQNRLTLMKEKIILRKILIFGNSGSGKTTLAKKLSDFHKLGHLDLDTLAWKPTNPPERKRLAESEEEIRRFMGNHAEWVIEGCYTDLLELVAAESSEIIFLDIPIAQCIANARNRAWEPHKYESKEAQDKNLDMLIVWISQYSERNGTFSRTSHLAFYERYQGRKYILSSNEEAHECN